MYQGTPTMLLRSMLRQHRQIAKEYKSRAKITAKRRLVDESDLAYENATLHLVECISIQRVLDQRGWTRNGPTVRNV